MSVVFYSVLLDKLFVYIKHTKSRWIWEAEKKRERGAFGSAVYLTAKLDK